MASKKLDNITDCRICHRTLDDDPRVLPCSHTYHFNCIKREARDNNGQFQCEQDGTKVSGSSIDTLPVNYTMIDVIEYLESIRGSIQCSNCSRSKAKHWCKNCNQSYCQNCSDDVHQQPALEKHEIVPVDEKPVELIPCGKHTDERLKYWCQKCNTFVCSDCLLYGHKDHSYTDIKNAADAIESKIHNSFTNIESSLEGKTNEVKKALTTVNKEHESNKNELNKAMDHLKEIVYKHRNEILGKIQTFQNDDNQHLNNHNNQLETELESLDQQKEILKTLVQSRDQSKLMRASQGFVSYIKRRNGTLNGLQLPRKHRYQLEGIDRVDSIRERILDCGKIHDKGKEPKPDVSTFSDKSELEQLRAAGQTEEELDLGGKVLTDRDMEIVGGILQNNTNPTTLRLSGNQIDDQKIERLVVGLQQNNKLTTLHLYDNQIGDYGVQALAKALEKNGTLTTLDLSRNEIGDQGVLYLSTLLRHNKRLTTLHLSQNRIDDQGATHLANALRENRVLTTLHLSQNQIGDKGAEALANALKENKTLTMLNLHWNDIGDKGAISFANAFKKIKLTTLYLSHNQIGKNGVEKLVNALKTQKTLRTLSLQENQIDQKTQEYAKAELQNNKKLTVLWGKAYETKQSSTDI